MKLSKTIITVGVILTSLTTVLYFKNKVKNFTKK